MPLRATGSVPYPPVCILILTTSVGTRTKQAPISPTDAANMWVSGELLIDPWPPIKCLWISGFDVSYVVKKRAAPKYCGQQSTQWKDKELVAVNGRVDRFKWNGGSNPMARRWAWQSRNQWTSESADCMNYQQHNTWCRATSCGG